MSKRVWAVVGLFAGLAIMLGVWMAMSADPTTRAHDKGRRSGTPNFSKPEVRRVEMDPATLRNRLTPSAIVERRTQVMKKVEVKKPAPEGGAGAPTPDGVFPLDQDGVKNAVEARMEDLEACYETALFHTPGLSAKMTLVMDVQPAEGQAWATVEGVDAETDLDAPVFEGCVATVFEELKFAATEPTKLRYPVVFEADEDE